MHEHTRYSSKRSDGEIKIRCKRRKGRRGGYDMVVGVFVVRVDVDI